MNEPRYWVLLIEDNPGDVRLVREMLAGDSNARLEIEYASTLAEGFERLQLRRYDVALLDLGLPDSQGLQTITRFRDRFSDVPVIVLTGNDDLSLALAAVQAGAQDYLIKGEISSSPLVRAVRYAIERRRTEETLRASERLYRNVVETTNQGIWTIDEKQRTTFVNRRMAEMLGYQVDEMAGRPIFEFLPVEMSPLAVAGTDAICRGVPGQHDVELLRKDGTRLWTILSATPLTDGAGTYTGALAAVTDITDRMRIDEALKKSEAALKEAQRVAHVGHWEHSALTGATTWSDEHYRMLGIPIGSVTPSHELLLGMMDPGDRRRQEEAVARALDSSDAADAPTDIDLRITRPDGAALVVSERFFVDRDAAGNVVAFHGTLQDITRRVATEQALRESEAALAEAQQIAHIGSWILYPESGEVRASAETFRMFAIDPRPIAPLQLFVERVHEEDRVRVEAEVAASSLTGRQDFEYRIVTPQGTRFIHALARLHEVGEAHPSLIGTTQDITEQKAVEEALRQQTESLERSNAELERFNRLAVNRELRMIELKRQVNDLCAQLGQPAPYALRVESALAKETS